MKTGLRVWNHRSVSEGRRKRLTLIATILGSQVVFLDATVVNVALPAIQEDLDTGLAGQQWVVEAYLLALVALLLVGGSLGDLYGRRRLFMIGLAGFAVTSVLCAAAPSSELLIAARALQGLAGALLVPGSLAILTATFEGEERGRAIGTWTAWSGIVTVVGPAAGGFLVESLSWRWIFWVTVPMIVATLYLTHRVVSESADPEACPGIDYFGIGLSAFGLGGPVFALIQQPTHGWSDPMVLIPLVTGIACLVGFVIWEGRARAPMMPLSLFRVRNFAAANLATLAAYAGLMGGFFFITLYLQQVAGYSPLEAGLATTPVAVLLFALSPRFGALSAKSGPRLPMTMGPIVAGAGMLLLRRVGVDADYVSEVLPGVILFGLGLAATVAPLTTTVLNSVEERHAGVASGINNAISRVAGLVAIAALGAAISAGFGSSVDDALAGQTLSPEQRTAVADAKSQPLAGDVRGDLSPEERAAIEPAVHDSSHSAFQLGIGISGGLMIAGGLISFAGVRNPREPVEPQHATRAATAGDCGHGPTHVERLEPELEKVPA